MFFTAAATSTLLEMGVWASAAGRIAEPIRQPRDRLMGQPQERQHSAALGGTRDRLPSARGAIKTGASNDVKLPLAATERSCKMASKGPPGSIEGLLI